MTCRYLSSWWNGKNDARPRETYGNFSQAENSGGVEGGAELKPNWVKV